jgi:ABC-type transport system involved in multi-copper enzyme maturation permease subunit
MLKLLKIEWNKLLPSKSFRWLIAIYIVVFAIYLFIANTFYEKIEPLRETLQVTYNPMVFPDVWIISFWLAQPFILLAAIIVIALVVNEFNYRTARQHVIDGLTRWEFVLAKFFTVVLITVICTAIAFLLGTLVGLTNEQSNTPTGFGEVLAYMAAFFIRGLGLLTFAMFLGMWIKRTGVSILFFIVLHMGFVAMILRFRVEEKLGFIMPIGAMNRLIRNIFFFIDDENIETVRNLGLTEIIIAGSGGEMVLVLLYTAAFVGLSYLVIMRKDLK